MMTPEHDESRSSRARNLAVESLEGRRLPSGIGPAPMGPGAPAATFVYTIDGFGGPHGPMPPPPRDFSAAAMPGRFGEARMSSGNYFVSGDSFHASASPDRGGFLKFVQFGDAGEGLVRLDPRAGGLGGGGDGQGPWHFSESPAVMMPPLRIDATFVAVALGAMRARASVDDSPDVVVFARSQRATPSSPDAPPLTEAPSTAGSGALPIAAAPDSSAVQPPKGAPAGVAGPVRVAAGAVEPQDRRAVAVAGRAEPTAVAFRPSAAIETTSAKVALVPAGQSESENQSVAVRPTDAVSATRSTSRRVAYGGEDAAPEGAELLTHFLPLDRATLEVAIDRVFGQLGSLSPELPELTGPIDWTSAVTTLLAAGIAADLVVRALNRYRRDEGAADDDEAGYVLFPGLPGGWKLEER